CGYHQSCHQKSLHIGTPGLELLRLVPGVKAVQLNHGCCGNPGMWGAVKKNRDESLWIGRKLFEQIGDSRLGFECGVSESSCCKLQIENACKKPVLHPVQILAQAYGYSAPQVRDDDEEDAPAPKPAPEANHA